MQRVDYNRPDTRARVEARRRRRKQRGKGDVPESDRHATTAEQQAFPLGAAVPEPLLKKQSWRKARPSRSTSTARPRDKAARTREQQVAQVQPGPRRVLLQWVITGRLFSLLLFLLSVGFLGYLFTSSDLTIQQVAVKGNHLVPNETIVELSGVRDASIWFINQDAIRHRLQASPYIEKVKIHVALPDHAAISIVERKPEVRWRIGPVQYLVDSSGKVLEIAQDIPDPDTLVIEDTTHRSLEPHDQLDPDALKLAQSLSVRLPTELELTPAVIGWNIGLGVYIRTNDDALIIFGKSDNLNDKLAILNQLLQEDTSFTYLDLRPSNPFYQNKPPSEDDGHEQQS
jgi:cell division protein FtsQ